MRMMDQTKFGINDGNCLSACVASFLDILTDEVPIIPDTVHWQEWINKWLIENHKLALLVFVGSLPDYLINSYYIAVGQSSRSGQSHACIYRNGELAHDPHPSRLGLKYLEQSCVFMKVFN